MKGKFDLPEKCSDVTKPANAIVKDEVVIYHRCMCTGSIIIRIPKKIHSFIFAITWDSANIMPMHVDAYVINNSRQLVS